MCSCLLNGSVALWLDDAVLQHMQEPLRLDQDTILHECRLREVRCKGGSFRVVAAIEWREGRQGEAPFDAERPYHIMI